MLNLAAAWRRMLVLDCADTDVAVRVERHRIDVIWLRDRACTAAALEQRLLELCSASDCRVPVIVSGSAALAARCGAHGVQLSSTECRTEGIDVALALGLRVGASVHSVEQVVAARELGADWCVFGPIRDTPKPIGVVRGVGFDPLKAIRAAAQAMPVIAIGGLTEADFDAVLATGIAGIAAIRGFR